MSRKSQKFLTYLGSLLSTRSKPRPSRHRRLELLHGGLERQVRGRGERRRQPERGQAQGAVSVRLGTCLI